MSGEKERPRLADGRPAYEVHGTAEGMRGDLEALAWLQRRRIAAPRKPGRPGWTRELVVERYAEARAATTPPHSLADIAAAFRRLDGTIGMEPDSLAKRLRKYRVPTE